MVDGHDAAGVPGLRVAFAGTPTFAEQALGRLLASRHRVLAVLTQPDRPAGRGQKAVASPVKRRALAAGLPVLQPPSLRRPPDGADALAALAALAPDVMVVAAYGLILPQPVLDLPRLGCLNIHASLLPRWRGAAPIVRAIEAGDEETGVCIMRMDAGLDTGPVGLVKRTPIGANENAARLHDRLADMGAEAIVEVLDVLAGASTHIDIEFVAQPADGVTYAAKIDKAEARIRWQDDAVAIARRIRAFDPVPGASAVLARLPDGVLRLFEPDTIPGSEVAGAVPADPGTVIAVGVDGVTVACGRGAVRVGSLQRPGSRRLPAADFLRGFPLRPGDAFDPSPAPISLNR